MKCLLLSLWVTLVTAGLLGARAAQTTGPLPGDLVVTRLLQHLVPYESYRGTLLVASGSLVWGVPLLTLLVALVHRRWGALLVLILASGTTRLLLEPGLKALVARPRPAAPFVRVYEVAASSSFPSGTALVAVVLVVLSTYLLWEMQQSRQGAQRSTRSRIITTLVVSLLLLVVNGLARVVVGAHWMTDVVAGWLFGSAWALVLVGALWWWHRRHTAPGNPPGSC